MKLAPGVELIETSFWERSLRLVLFQGQEVALVDTGLVGTPADVVIPYLDSIGLTPKDLSLIIVTHAHADHFGGNEELWLASERQVRFAAHRLDQAWIEDPPGETRQGYAHFVEVGVMSADELEGAIEVSGNGVKLDHVLEGGEVFDLGDGLELEIVFASGHSPGNVCVLDRKNKVLAQGETVAGVAQYNVRGELLTTPFYEDPEIYLKTIATVARLDFETLVPSHLPLMDRAESARFFGESVDFALRFEDAVKQHLRDLSTEEPVTSVAVLKSMDNLWGQYPADMGMYMLLASHLKGLVKRGLVEGSLLENDGLSWVGPDGDDQDDRDDLAPLADLARAAIQDMGR